MRSYNYGHPENVRILESKTYAKDGFWSYTLNKYKYLHLRVAMEIKQNSVSQILSVLLSVWLSNWLWFKIIFFGYIQLLHRHHICHL